ncbi:uncharacterized membrane protein YhaH (DUF805 family) [Kitasatospora sp. MAA4]|uniref:hypothetical protein n=1 Tax=Kitasatospora sp. MAA4 TaxID=3035093 RepID=UPI002473AD00|nr:hypothetical protein [Kitasatospora sp. MAA4]MDH6132585.1 uncharacterized membrane protein YhaH (DUF805 family) [Kitasatospora sp. MAA4]
MTFFVAFWYLVVLGLLVLIGYCIDQIATAHGLGKGFAQVGIVIALVLTVVGLVPTVLWTQAALRFHRGHPEAQSMIRSLAMATAIMGIPAASAGIGYVAPLPWVIGGVVVVTGALHVAVVLAARTPEVSRHLAETHLRRAASPLPGGRA